MHKITSKYFKMRAKTNEIKNRNIVKKILKIQALAL